MALKILILVSVLAALIFIGAKVFKSSIRVYNPLTWALVELGWYMISFIAVCIGLFEIERIVDMNKYRLREKLLQEHYEGKRGMLYAQTLLLKPDTGAPPHIQESVYWFHKMRTLMDEGWQSNRWENFVQYSRYYIFREPGSYADVLGSMSEFNWPANRNLDPQQLFLKDEIKVVVDSLHHLKLRKHNVLSSRPEENTNYQIRYLLLALYLTGLAMKLLKIYADYRKQKHPVSR
jgi:hypothetical protein